MVVKLKQLIFITTLFLILGTSANEFSTPQFDLHELEFSNRAKCAVESGKPTKSAFLMVSNVDAAKAIYRLAKFQGEDAGEMTKRGINRFRFSVVSLVNLIHDTLTSKHLPLLPADITIADKHIPSRYKSIMNTCRQGEYCEQLDDYLADLWEIANKNWNAETKKAYLSKIDNFHSRDNYLNSNDYKRNTKPAMTCAYLKRFSPLQAHLFGTKPDKFALDSIADAVKNQSEKYANCDDFDAQENLQVAAYEINLPNLKKGNIFIEEKWLKKGFDYWHTMKLFLSFAFRKAPEMDRLAFPFGNLFRGINLEESVMLVPNGCRSMAPAKCDGDRLALNSIREFAKKDFASNAGKLDILSETPVGPDDALVEDMIPSVNIDELELADHRTTSAWLEKFSGNLSSSRALLKKRLIKAINHFSFVSKAISADDLMRKLDEQFDGVLLSGKRTQLSARQQNELYYLCGEFSFSQHEKWSFIRGNLEILQKAKFVDDLASQIAQVTTNESFNYFMSLGDKINQACYNLRQHDVWNDEFELNREGFMPWYTKKIYENKFRSKHGDNIRDYLRSNQPLLAFPSYERSGSVDDVICAHSSDCARKTVEATLALYSATQYASTFWSLEEKIKSPDLFNPYAERTACKVYDPWFKTRSLLFGFLWDMGQAAASAFVPGMIYTKADLQPKMVTSFKQLVSDGKLQYDTQYTKQSVMMSVSADFGPLTGAPCAVSINRSANNPLAPLRFTGITAGACSTRENHELNVQSASDIGPNKGSGSSECVACFLNFESVSGAVAYHTSNVGPTFFIFRGLYNLYQGLKDPHNIPRSWNVHPYDAAETKARFGEIPKNCIRKLIKGESCLQSTCASAASDYLREKMHGYITGFTKISNNSVKVWHSLCNGQIELITSVSRDHDSNEVKSCRVRKMLIPRNCMGNYK